MIMNYSAVQSDKMFKLLGDMHMHVPHTINKCNKYTLFICISNF